MVVVFIVSFGMQAMLFYPHPKESVEVGFDERWNIGSCDFGVSPGDRHRPELTFEYGGINYSTINLAGTLPVKAQCIAEEDLIKYSEKGKTFQKFFVRESAASSECLTAIYVLVVGKDIYYSYEDLAKGGDYYKFTVEEREEGVIVAHWQPDLKSFIFWTTLISVVISGVAGFFMYADERTK